MANLLTGWLLLNTAACSGAENEPGSPSCKRGVAWNGEQAAPDMARLAWWYNWSAGARASAGLEFVPMVWGGTFDDATLSSELPAGSRYLLGFNEPNFHEQANLSAAQAASLWPRLEVLAAERGLALVSPALNFCGDNAAKTGPCHDTDPVNYLHEFFAACADCRVDYVAVHWYNCDAESLSWYLDQFRVFGRPVWLTEFACAYGGDTSPAGQAAYMREALPLLERRPDVFRYAWFSADPIPSARVLTSDGKLTDLGQTYVGLAGESCQ